MNKRILELAKKVGYLDRGSNHTAYQNFDHEKFAELIIQDCISQVALIGVHNGESADVLWAVDKSIERIRDCFGIEK